VIDMAGERTMWLVWNPQYQGVCHWFRTEVDARCWFTYAQPDKGWRCDQITVKETDGE